MGPPPTPTHLRDEATRLEHVVAMAWVAGWFDDCLFTWRPWQEMPMRPLGPHERPLTRYQRPQAEIVALLTDKVDDLLGSRFLVLVDSRTLQGYAESRTGTPHGLCPIKLAPIHLCP